MFVNWPVALRAVGNHPDQPDFISKFTHKSYPLEGTYLKNSPRAALPLRKDSFLDDLG